jgi:UDP-N-acetylglucosamine 2-epimerase
MIISDSGSIQQEVATLGRRCVRLFPGELFPELESYPGSIYTPSPKIAEAIELIDGVDEGALKNWKNPLGNGNASKRIAEIITNEKA